MFLKYCLYNLHASIFADNLPSSSPHSALIKDLSVSTVKKVKVLIKHLLIDQNISCQQLIQSRLHFDNTQANLESFNGPQIDTPQTPSTTSAILTGASF